MKISSIEFAQNPYLFYDKLRANGSVHYLEKENGWLVIGYQQITNILLNSKLFTSDGENSFDPILLNCDPPKHTYHKNIVSGNKGILSNNRVEALAKKNRVICKSIIADFANKTAIDLLQDFALPFSSQVIMSLLGFHASNNTEIREWSYQSVSNKSIYDADFAFKQWQKVKPLIEQFIFENESAKNDLSEMFTYNLINSFSKEDLLNLIKILILGGNETTPNLISSAFYYLIKNQEFLEKLKKEPSLMQPFLNEILRLEAPTQIIQRVTKDDVRIDDINIPANSLLFLAIGAGNRDPTVFEKPNEFILSRKENKILSFGFGPHYCIGANLARQEAQIALEELINTFPDIYVSNSFDPIYRHSSHIRGIKEFPVILNKNNNDLMLQHRNEALNIINQDYNNYNEFPSFENYPNAQPNNWIYTFPSPFIHSNVVYSLLNANFKGKEALLEKAKNRILKAKEVAEVWRFWPINVARNAVPPDLDDTAICTLVLKKLGVKLHNQSVFLNAITPDSDILTWILPNRKMLLKKPLLFVKLLLERKKIKATISSNMLSYNDTEIGVSANVLCALGENIATKKVIAKIITSWNLDTENGSFYDKKIVKAFHVARAYNEGIKGFKTLENAIIALIEENYNNYCFAELLLSGLILKYYQTNIKLSDLINSKIIDTLKKENNVIQYYPYFTSKDRNYYGGSKSLTAAWFLELTNNWVDE